MLNITTPELVHKSERNEFFFHILFFYLLHIQEKKKHLSALHCSAVFTVVVDETVEELSWSARVSCSLFHLIGHGLPVAIASLFLCAYHSLSPVLSFHPSFLLNSLSLGSHHLPLCLICLHIF